MDTFRVISIRGVIEGKFVVREFYKCWLNELPCFWVPSWFFSADVYWFDFDYGLKHSRILQSYFNYYNVTCFYWSIFKRSNLSKNPFPWIFQSLGLTLSRQTETRKRYISVVLIGCGTSGNVSIEFINDPLQGRVSHSRSLSRSMC